jgi:hypothetical protein
MAYTTIKKPSDYFNTKLYSGTGSTQNITGVGFQPDFTWVKSRTSAEAHVLRDVVRGNFRLNTASTGAETDATSSISGFVSDGFTVATADAVNNASQTYASWNWLADNTSGSSNTDGSITSTVSANTTSGFSIVSWTGSGANATVGHGLGVAPKMIIIKNTIDAVNWEVGHNSIGWTKKLRLNTTDAETVDNGAFNDTAPTSSVFSLGNNGTSNGSGDGMIAYCFAEKKGFSKFGSYTGNGSTDGTFVYTGFKPAWVLLKNTTGDNWTLLDSTRDVDNPASARTLVNQSFAEGASNTIDFYSNGFKLLRTDAGENGSGIKYIYMAFAESPLVGTNNIPATAR